VFRYDGGVKATQGGIVFSPSDLITYLKSPFASWMDRARLEGLDLAPDQETEEEKLIKRTGDEHEAAILDEYKAGEITLITKDDFDHALQQTRFALLSDTPVIYQGALAAGDFAGYSDFLERTQNGWQVWDTKLACSPKPYYAIQLCCYSEMLAAMLNSPLPERFGIILGNKERVEFRVEDFIHYYHRVKERFLEMQAEFTPDLDRRPEPDPRADHGRWGSYSEAWLAERDHLVQVAGINVGQIKKLTACGIDTLTKLAETDSDTRVERLRPESLAKLIHQAKLQRDARLARQENVAATAPYDVLPHIGDNGEPLGLGCLPAPHKADVFFDMEGYPLMPGGLEYLFGAVHREKTSTYGADGWAFFDAWAHDRTEEKHAFESFIDWVYARWLQNPGMHIYHYAAYEVSAMRRLSTRHDTRQEQVDDLLRNDVFVDLYQIVRQGLRIGEGSYSLKLVERLYRGKREGDVTSAMGSIVQYANYVSSGRPADLLERIRKYNFDDCLSTAELTDWLRARAVERDIPPCPPKSDEPEVTPDKHHPDRLLAEQLRSRGAATLADLVGFHRREEKPMWWRMFDRATRGADELFDDAGCIAGIRRKGDPVKVARSLVQTYTFDRSQECKLKAGEKTQVMFAFNLRPKLHLHSLDMTTGELQLKTSQQTLDKHFGGEFPLQGSLLGDEHVPAGAIAVALQEIADDYLRNGTLPAPVAALLDRRAPAALRHDQDVIAAAVSTAEQMNGDCLVIQGPPGSGKTYCAGKMITHLVHLGKKVGICSNGHKAILNLMARCGEELTGGLVGIKASGDENDPIYQANPSLKYVDQNKDAHSHYSGGVVGGTAWLFSRPEWMGELDYLFIDEAGQVPLANAVAIGRAAKNIVLLGDQMQLEQPIEGAHPGDSRLSVLQYALKDVERSREDAPVYHAVIPFESGLFLNETRRMHPNICQFISDSIYEGRLSSHESCAGQAIDASTSPPMAGQSSGIVFCPVEHDGNVQRSDEEVAKVKEVLDCLIGQDYVDKDGHSRRLTMDDFLIMSPYNAQVRALQEALPNARVGSVDKFQGLEAPVCIVSLSCSYGHYGSRGLKFILDRNRMNVALSRAKCLAVVVADPRISGANAGSIEEMQLLNLFCKIVGETDPRLSASVT
jgi:uncharacterized protein